MEVLDGETIRVGAAIDTVRAEVEFALDSDGRVATISAPDRPRLEGGGFVERPWTGRFSDYRRHQGRWLPFHGEVGWVLEDEAFTTWKGEIDSWAIL